MEIMNHTDEILARLPKSTDVDEERIVGVIQEKLLTTSWAKQFFADAKARQIEFLKFGLNNLDNSGLIHSENQQVLKDLAKLGKAKIISGEGNLAKLQEKLPVLIVSNHLGDYKLATINPKELNLNLQLDQIHPFPMYYAPYQPIAEQLLAESFEAHVQWPRPLAEIERACGLITIIANQNGGLDRLENDTKNLLQNRTNSLLVVFPEGGTSGKRGGQGPYDLEKFHTGAFVIAAHLNLPILPVAKFFNPESGYELGILEPIEVKKDQDRDYYKEIASLTQNKLQNWLNSKKGGE